MCFLSSSLLSSKHLESILIHHHEAMKFASTRWDEAARAYLFHLVGCTLFANKIATYVEVKFLDFFRDLKGCSMYSCGTTTLTYLCEHLTSASFDGTKQISAYATLLQVIISPVICLLYY